MVSNLELNPMKSIALLSLYANTQVLWLSGHNKNTWSEYQGCHDTDKVLEVQFDLVRFTYISFKLNWKTLIS